MKTTDYLIYLDFFLKGEEKNQSQTADKWTVAAVRHIFIVE